MAFTNQSTLLTPLTPSMPLCTPISEQIEALPITPPDIVEKFDERTFKPDSTIIKKALHVLATERLALAHLEELYATSEEAQASLLGAIAQIIRTETHHGKVIFTGVGKSRHIATKLTATFISLGIHAVCMHPTEALHGDLGIIRPHDTVLMITFSGRTPELLTLLPHIPSQIPLIIMTSHLSPTTCPLLNHHTRISSQNYLLPTVMHESETTSFGISAPTSSTTITLALGDSLALTVADKLHSASGMETTSVFAANHPGGAIGAAFSQTSPSIARMSSIAIEVSKVPILKSSHNQPPRCLDILLAAARSPSGFVRTTTNHIVAPRRIQLISDPSLPVEFLVDANGSAVIERTDWISILGETSIEEAKLWIHKMRQEGNGRGKEFLRPGTLLGIVDKYNEVTGVVEIEELLGDDFDWD